jgi:PAS domain S-box-containing protein
MHQTGVISPESETAGYTTTFNRITIPFGDELLIMWMPDLLTLYLTLILTDIILTLIMVLYWKSNRTYYGYKTWVISLPFYCCSMILVMFSNILAGPLTIVLAVFLFILAYLMRLDSIRRFVRSKPLDLKIYIVSMIPALIATLYFTYGINSVMYRAIVVAIALSVTGFIGIIVLATSQEEETRTIRFALAGILAAIAVLYIVRVVTGLTVDTRGNVDLIAPVYHYALILAEITATGLFLMLNMARYQAELLRSENQVRVSEEKYRGVVTWANEGIILVQDDICKFANPKAVAMFGETESDLIDKPFLTFIHPGKQQIVRELHRRRVAGEKVQEIYETVGVNGAGEPVEIEINTRFITLNGKFTDIVFIRDIRESKQQQKALEQATKKLNLLNQVTFNDLGDAVNSLSSYQALVRETLKGPGAPVGHLLEKEWIIVQKIADVLRSAQVYQDLGLRPAKWQEVRLVFLMAFSHLDTLMMNHSITTGDLEIFADPLLEQVFLILAENVFAHGETATLITIGYLQEADGSLTILFEDNGVGIPDDLKERIFSSEFQGTRSAGLFLTREILEITEITIRESGVFGSGARFEIRVPKRAYRFTAFQS